MEIVEAHPSLARLFLDVRIVQQRRFASRSAFAKLHLFYALLAQERRWIGRAATIEDEWLRLIYGALNASDSVAEIECRLENEPALDRYVQSIKSQLS